MHKELTYDEYIDMLYEERLNFEHTEIARVQSDNISVTKKIKTMPSDFNKQTINALKDFYIKHAIVHYNYDWDKFWEDHTNIIQLESELDLIEPIK